MSSETIQRRPLAAAALTLIALEALLALVGVRIGPLFVIVLSVAPGLALVPLLPAVCRRSPVATLAATPILGSAAVSVAVTTIAATGLELTGFTVRLVPLALVLVGIFLLSDDEPELHFERPELLGALGLAGAVVAGVVLHDQIIGGSPVPGNDWAKYLLYADEIRRQGSMLIDNPYWLLGVPFREDPGVPALYGGYLIGAGGNAAVLMHGIWVFAVLGVLSMYALVRSLWGELAGVFAAFFWAVAPVTGDILGWHGLANQAALAVMPIVLLYLAVLLSDGLLRREAIGLGLLLVALAGFHRLSFAVMAATIALCVLVGLTMKDRRRIFNGVMTAAIAAVALGIGVAYHLIDRTRTFGGTQGFDAYESQKIELDLVARDLTYAFTGLAILGVLAAIWFVWRDRRLIPSLALFGVIALLSYSWVVEFPLAYIRMVYFLPVALMPLAAYVLTKLPWRYSGLIAGVAIVVAMFIPAWGQTDNVRLFYTFATPASLKGLDYVEERIGPDEVVVTDRCWSFLATWLLHTRTLAALEPADIQPKAEVPRAEDAREILAGTPEGTDLAKELGVRYLIVNPECTDVDGRPIGTPIIGGPVFVSRRLVVIDLQEQ